MKNLELVKLALDLRWRLDMCFAPDTAAPDTPAGGPASSGHCAAVAVLVSTFLGGTYVSAFVDGRSHWFNRFEDIDIDLTGDQFGRDRVCIGAAGTLFPGTRERDRGSLNEETLARARALAARMVRA